MASQTKPASTVPTLTSLATSLTVGLKTSVFFLMRVPLARSSRSASRVTLPTAAASGLAWATRTLGLEQVVERRDVLGLPLRDGEDGVMRASGMVSAISAFLAGQLSR